MSTPCPHLGRAAARVRGSPSPAQIPDSLKRFACALREYEEVGGYYQYQPGAVGKSPPSPGSSPPPSGLAGSRPPSVSGASAHGRDGRNAGTTNPDDPPTLTNRTAGAYYNPFSDSLLYYYAQREVTSPCVALKMKPRQAGAPSQPAPAAVSQHPAASSQLVVHSHQQVSVGATSAASGSTNRWDSPRSTNSPSPGSPCTVHKQRSFGRSPSESLKGNWKKGKELGRGAFGKVYCAIDLTTGRQIAVKEITITGSDVVQALKREIEVLKVAKHENLVQYLGLERVGTVAQILMELVSGGTILALIKAYASLPPAVTRNYTAQIIDAVVYLHNLKVIHRDLKCANVLLTVEGVAKVADYGCARHIAAGMADGASMSVDYCKTFCGTPCWMAPEVKRGQERARWRQRKRWQTRAPLFAQSGCQSAPRFSPKAMAEAVAKARSAFHRMHTGAHACAAFQKFWGISEWRRHEVRNWRRKL
eukprot:gene57127-biopygen38974